MPTHQNFFAFVKDNEGNSEIKRIRVNQPLQRELEQIFEDQRIQFLSNIDTEVPYNGDWKPDNNEVLTLDNVDEATMLVNAINANATSFSDMDISNFLEEPIKAIFTGLRTGNRTRVLVQKFSSRQALSLNQLPLIKMQTGNVFVKATDDVFTIDNKLVAIIENDTTKFKSFHNMRMVFDLSEFFKEATDEDLQELAQHASLRIDDMPKFITLADTQVRKMVHSITSSEVLDTYSVTQISDAASTFNNIPIVVENGEIILPTDKRELKEVLHFLLEDIYKGPLSGGSYLTNSKRSIE